MEDISIKAQIEENIRNLQYDIELLEKEKRELAKDFSRDECCFEYKSNIESTIFENTMQSLESTIATAKQEIYLFQNILLREESFLDIDYYNFTAGQVRMILDAWKDIISFDMANFGKSDYKKDIISISSTIKSLRRFFSLQPIVSVPRQPHEIIRMLVFELKNVQLKAIFGDVIDDILPNAKLSDDQIKVIVAIILNKEGKWRMPKNQELFNEEFLVSLFSKFDTNEE